MNPVSNAQVIATTKDALQQFIPGCIEALDFDRNVAMYRDVFLGEHPDIGVAALSSLLGSEPSLEALAKMMTYGGVSAATKAEEALFQIAVEAHEPRQRVKAAWHLLKEDRKEGVTAFNLLLEHPNPEFREAAVRWFERDKKGHPKFEECGCPRIPYRQECVFEYHVQIFSIWVR